MVLVDIEGGSVKKKSSEYKMTIFLFIIMGQDANNDDYVDYSDDDDDNDLDVSLVYPLFTLSRFTMMMITPVLSTVYCCPS